MIDAYDLCGGEAMLEMYGQKRHVARKTHVCCECGCEIKSGERYERAEGLNREGSGSWETFKTCMPCVELRDATIDGGTAHCCLYEIVDEEVNERRAASGAEHTHQEDFVNYADMVSRFNKRRQKAKDDYLHELHE